MNCSLSIFSRKPRLLSQVRSAWLGLWRVVVEAEAAAAEEAAAEAAAAEAAAFNDNSEIMMIYSGNESMVFRFRLQHLRQGHPDQHHISPPPFVDIAVIGPFVELDGRVDFGVAELCSSSPSLRSSYIFLAMSSSSSPYNRIGLISRYTEIIQN